MQIPADTNDFRLVHADLGAINEGLQSPCAVDIHGSIGPDQGLLVTDILFQLDAMSLTVATLS